MADITVSAVSTFPGLNQILVGWNFDDPNIGGLGYLQLKHFEIWSASANNVNLASLIGTSRTTTFVDAGGSAGLSAGETRYYWVRPINNAGTPGSFSPGATNGALGQTRTSLSVSDLTAADLTATNQVSSPSVSARLISDLAAILSHAGGAIDITALSVHAPSGVIQVLSAETISLAYAGPNYGTLSGVGSMSMGGSDRSINGNRTIAQTSVAGAAGNIFYDSLFSVSGSLIPISIISVTGNAISSLTTGASTNGIVSTAIHGFAFYASGGYGPFTGAHDALIEKGADIEIGDVLVDTDRFFRAGVSDAMSVVEPSSTPETPAIGILSLEPSPFSRAMKLSSLVWVDYTDPLMDELEERYDHLIVNALGEGQVNVCGEGGAIMAGDLLCTSSVRGKLMRQSDDVVRSYTVARARENASLEPEEVKMIACIYMCG
jgi:hypothetical protein